MKDELDMIFSNKETDIEKISSRYKAVDDKRKEKIYAITQRKYKLLKSENREASDEDFTISVQGVERYSRPKWYRGFSAAAAVLVLIGGVSGSFLFARSQKVNNMHQNSVPLIEATSVEVTTSSASFADDAVVDVLLSNLEMIQKPLYAGTDSTDFSDGIYFNKDEYSDISDSIVNLTKYYYAVTDERLDTMEEVEAVLGDTFIYEMRNSYIGGDLSNFEVGYDFGDDNLANKYVKTFIGYNGKVYAQSLCEYNETYAYNFESSYNFSDYKLVSSQFVNGGTLLNRIIKDENSEPIQLDELVTCTRVYERPDGQKVSVEVQLLPENGVWKIAAFSLNSQYDGEITEHSETKLPTLDGKDASDKSAVEEYGEVDYHDFVTFDSFEQAETAMSEIQHQSNNGKYQFRKLDVEKYANQILEASDEDISTLENKSYIYHLMLNSSRYFDTVDLTFTLSGASNTDKWNKTEHCLADNKGKYIYVNYTFDEGESHNDFTICGYDGLWINADNNNKTYFESDYTDVGVPENFIPDDYRFINYYDENGHLVSISLTDVVFGQLGSECLYTSPSHMSDFSVWHIEKTENILGRDCAMIVIDANDYLATEYVDLRTGIILRSTEKEIYENVTRDINVTNIEINEPLDYIYFDPTGYTNDSADNYSEQ